jgi:putative spermidine/putrescine transport system permease protein
MSDKGFGEGAVSAKPDRFRVPGATGLLLVAPLVLLIAFFLVIPLLKFVWLSVDNREMARALSSTAAALQTSEPVEIPGDPVFAALAQDLGRNPDDVPKLASHLNFFQGGMISLVRKTAEALPQIEPTRAGFVAFDKRWEDARSWRAIILATQPLTYEHYLEALDLGTVRPAVSYAIEFKPENQQIFKRLWLRTISVALVVVVVCTAIGYPIANYLSRARGVAFTIALGVVLLPFWTPLLARIASWVVLLESNGIINRLLIAAGLVDAAHRPQLLNNMFATVLVMSYVLLPYAVLPTYAVMSRINPGLYQAALTLGASPVRAFLTVYLPQTLPGVLASGILIFVFSFGFYLTPELVGGPSGSLIGNQIAYNFSKSLNWGLAGALSAMLLVVVALSALLLRAATARQSGGTSLRAQP